MLSGTQFYYRTTRRCVIAFGNLFRDLVLVKYSNDPTNTSNFLEESRQTVPLMYGGKEDYYVRNAILYPKNQTPGPNSATANSYAGQEAVLPHPTEIKLPVMSFELKDIQYASDRKQQSQLQQFMQTGQTGLNNQWQGVPYDLKFQLAIFARNMEDGLQIVEQILPWFTPSYTLSILMVPQMQIFADVPLTLNDVTWENDYQGEAPDQIRRIIWTLDFTMQAKYYGPVYSGGIIQAANANIFFYASAAGGAVGALGNSNTQLVMANTGLLRYSPGELVYQGPSLAEATAYGTVASFANTVTGNANAALYVYGVNGRFVANQNVYGALTAASWNVYAVPNTAQTQVVQIEVTPNPANANAQFDFGYTTTIFETPNIP